MAEEYLAAEKPVSPPGSDSGAPPVPASYSPEGSGTEGIKKEPKSLCLARWDTRFWAWLIDFILVILFINIVRGALDPFWKLPQLWEFWRWEFFAVTFETLIFFFYWTVMDGYRGQSIGKMVMNLKVVSREGKKISYPAAAVESFGKAVLLPLDCLIGWLAMPGSKQRVFNRISHTIVIRTDYREPDGIVYVKEKE
jgi:uncharacterized RDD family membrane protein YckC